jgi:hypothetical protein
VRHGLGKILALNTAKVSAASLLESGRMAGGPLLFQIKDIGFWNMSLTPDTPAWDYFV